MAGEGSIRERVVGADGVGSKREAGQRIASGQRTMSVPAQLASRIGGAELERCAERVRLPLHDIIHPLDLAAGFGREAPVEVDLGCGDGRFLVLSALANPSANFLGIERRAERVRRACRKAAAAGCNNVRVVLVESSYAVKYLLPKGSVRRLHILFPDPWPKRRHAGNRLLNEQFFAAAKAVLAPGGEMRLKTDDERYFREAVAAAEGCGGLDRIAWDVEGDPPIQTTFEARFAAEGRVIFAARWVLVG